MQIGHADSAQQSPDDPEESLVRAAQVEVGPLCAPVPDLSRRTINRSVQVSGEFPDGSWGEHVGSHGQIVGFAGRPGQKGPGTVLNYRKPGGIGSFRTLA